MTTAQYQIGALLVQVGARPASAQRFDCPECGERRTVAVDDARGLFCCHHAGCGFRGGIGTLKARLGIRREWLSRDEYVRQVRARERADAAAAALYTAVKKRRLELLEDLRCLNRLAMTAHFAGPDHHVTWDAFSHVYRQLLELRAELAILEESPAAPLVRFLIASEQERASQIRGVLLAGGVRSFEAKFVRLED